MPLDPSHVTWHRQPVRYSLQTFAVALFCARVGVKNFTESPCLFRALYLAFGESQMASKGGDALSYGEPLFLRMLLAPAAVCVNDPKPPEQCLGHTPIRLATVDLAPIESAPRQPKRATPAQTSHVSPKRRPVPDAAPRQDSPACSRNTKLPHCILHSALRALASSPLLQLHCCRLRLLPARHYVSAAVNNRAKAKELEQKTSEGAAMNGHVNGAAAATTRGGPLPGGKADKGADFANYFCTYAFLYHQKEMLSDRVRMDAYYDSIFKNARHFKGKTVLDVGTGSGILAIWSAQAGARKVYAVEATDMAAHARTLVAGNNVQNIVEVIEGSVEDISLPEQVDIIISEWMGYFLVRESMFDSVIYARDKWLKPTGMMYPSHARMWIAPMQTSLGERKIQEYQHAMGDWSRFIQDTNDQYGVDMRVLNDPYREEQRKYFLQTSVWNSLHPNQIIGEPALVMEFDCLKATLEQTASVRSQFRIPIDNGNVKMAGFAGWFDVHFRGCPSDPADTEVELTTAPSVDDTTHWGQQVFLLHPAVNTRSGDVLVGELDITRSKQNHRLMDVKVAHTLERQGSPPAPPTISAFFIE